MKISHKIAHCIENSPYKSKIDVNNASYMIVFTFMIL